MGPVVPLSCLFPVVVALLMQLYWCRMFTDLLPVKKKSNGVIIVHRTWVISQTSHHFNFSSYSSVLTMSLGHCYAAFSLLHDNCESVSKSCRFLKNNRWRNRLLFPSRVTDLLALPLWLQQVFSLSWIILWRLTSSDVDYRPVRGLASSLIFGRTCRDLMV